MAREKDPVAAVCGVVMERFVEVTGRAPPDSPLGRARTRLGERYVDVVVASLRARVIAALTGTGAEETAWMIEACRDLGATAVIVSIVADATADVIAAGSALPDEELLALVADARDILWPNGDPDAQWDAGTVAEVARVFTDAGQGPDDPEPASGDRSKG